MFSWQFILDGRMVSYISHATTRNIWSVSDISPTLRSNSFNTICAYVPVNLHQYLIIWAAGLNNGFRIYGSELWSFNLCNSLLQRQHTLWFLLWVSIRSRISMRKLDMLQSCRNTPQILKKPHTVGIKQSIHIHCTALPQRFICEHRSLSSTQPLHIVIVIGFKTEEHWGRQPRANHKNHRKVRWESQRTTNPSPEISLFGNHETGFL